MANALFGNIYTSVYWCLFPPAGDENVIPQLQDCQDNLQARLQRLQQRQLELSGEMKAQKHARDRTKLRRMYLEFKSVTKDIGVTENTLWVVDRQIQLFERSELDSLVVDTLKSSSSALQDISREVVNLQGIDELTDTLQNRMQEINEMNESVSTALQRGLDEDYMSLETELDAFLNDDATQNVVLALPSTDMPEAAAAAIADAKVPEPGTESALAGKLPAAPLATPLTPPLRASAGEQVAVAEKAGGMMQELSLGFNDDFDPD